MDEVKINCWKTIGVWAVKEDRTCEKLLEAVHCHNCEVFVRAGRALLNQKHVEIIEDNIQWTENKKQRSINKQEMQTLIVVQINEQQIAIPSQLVTEVAKSQGVQKIPHVKNKVIAGIVNLSGKAKLCFSLASLLNITENPDGEKFYLLIEYQNQEYVIQVDEVISHIRFNKSEVNVIDSKNAKAQNYLVSGVLVYKGIDTLVINKSTLLRELESRLYE